MPRINGNFSAQARHHPLHHARDIHLDGGRITQTRVLNALPLSPNSGGTRNQHRISK
ncbi:hypothetical protein [Bradyrhizobium sp. STM 3809]|uniref:hypothetical protein n=1 Tax=Bradyrhizobium sp. STM 3809 TaxID=551936 RepID=UPI0014783A99|nr:hypothetical protein [Bradyrhizobium sp. STM 3809]